MKTKHWFIIFLILFTFLPLRLQAITSKVSLVDGSSPKMRAIIGNNLTAIINCLDCDKINSVVDKLSPEGLISLTELVRETKCQNVEPLYETNLIVLPNGGGYEVRNIKVIVDMRETKGTPYQYLVFSIDDDGLVTDVRFAIEKHRYEEIMSEGELLQDFADRQEILSFIEIFRTAYNRKDVTFLEQVFSDDALILVGKVLKKKEDAPDMLEKSSLSRDQIILVKKNKVQYINSLHQVFAANEYIQVNFKEIKLHKHNNKEKIYGVTLKQNWHSSNYKDEGYLFLMMDFREQDNPLIHVRSWQPEKFPDGSTVSLGDFELIE